MALASEAFQKVLIPGYRYIPTKRNIRSWKLEKEIKKSLLNLIGRRRQNSRSEELQDHGPKDLLGLMIRASAKESKSEMESESESESESEKKKKKKKKRSEYSNSSSPSSKITVRDIAEECKSFFFAGEQTTSNLMTWTTVLLAMHPQWQVEAREEVIKVCGSRDVPSKDHIVKLKTLSMILNETLRLYPPIVATIRRAKMDVELGGYKILRGTELLIPILAVHHDQATWGSDASEFNPARFAGGVARAAKHPAALIPFGLGLRTCVGQNLALLQAKLTLAIVLQRFSFRLDPSYQHAPTVLMLLHPQYGAPILFRRLDLDPIVDPDQGY